MKKCFVKGISAIFLFFLWTVTAYPQTDKEVDLKRGAQTEVTGSSDQYVIGPEDILYIHV